MEEGESTIDVNDKLNSLKEKLRVCEEERSEYLDGWQRNKADLANYRRSVEQEKGELRALGVREVALDLLPVLDTLALATSHGAWTELPKDWRMGVEHVVTLLDAVLERHNVIKLAKVGDVFDPSKHEATETIVVDSPNEDNIVQAVMQQGFAQGGRVLRPAKIKVGEYKSN